METTARGFDIFEFVDRYSQECSIQKSSLATEDAIWLGVSQNRMHLTQDMVRALLPMLQCFVETGELDGSIRGTQDHAAALESAGYVVATAEPTFVADEAEEG